MSKLDNYSRFFESRTKTQISADEELSKYKDLYISVDEKSLIPFDEFFKSIDFQCISKCSEEYGSDMVKSVYTVSPYLLRSIRSDIQISNYPGDLEDHIFFDMSRNTSNNTRRKTKLYKDLDFVSRNIIFLTSVVTGGHDGGNCYDGVAEPFDTGKFITKEDFRGFMSDILECVMMNLPTFDDPKNMAAEIINTDYVKESRYSVHEMYGNGDDYSCFYITLFDIFKFLSEKSCF